MKYELKGKKKSEIPTLKILTECVCKVTGISEESLFSSKRTRLFVTARKIFAYIAINHLKLRNSLVSVALDKDHAAIIHLNRKALEHLEVSDSEFCKYYYATFELFQKYFASPEDNDIEEIKLLVNDVLSLVQIINDKLCRLKAREDLSKSTLVDIVSLDKGDDGEKETLEVTIVPTDNYSIRSIG